MQLMMKGMTPLHKFTMFGHTESAKLLIDNGANIQIDNNGDTPLLVVIMTGGNFDIFKVLIEKANLSIQNKTYFMLQLGITKLILSV